ncbi:hypothetical protein Hanom_Chr03g00192571 [Helianthus anomalus]
MFLETYRIYKKNYITALRLTYKKPAALAFCASVLDLVAFVCFTLFKTKNNAQLDLINVTMKYYYMYTLL